MSYERHSSRWGTALRGAFFLAALFAAAPAHAQTESDAYAIDGVRLTMPEDALILPPAHGFNAREAFAEAEMYAPREERQDADIVVTGTRTYNFNSSPGADRRYGYENTQDDEFDDRIEDYLNSRLGEVLDGRIQIPDGVSLTGRRMDGDILVGFKWEH